jgi:hypothetical protein
MPVFINEVVVRGEIPGEARRPEPGAATTTEDPGQRARLIAEVTQAVVDRLEYELDRRSER